MVQEFEGVISSCFTIVEIEHSPRGQKTHAVTVEFSGTKKVRESRCPAVTVSVTEWYCQVNDIQTAQPIDGFIPFVLGHDLGARHRMPFTKCPRTKLAIVNRSRQVPSQLEQISYHAINCKKALSLSS